MVGHSTTRMHRTPSKYARLVGIALLASLAACGVTYNSPAVREYDPDTYVEVVDITGPAIQQANASPYSPRSVPDVFYASASGGGSIRGAGALPAAPQVPDTRAEALFLNPPPIVEPGPYIIGIGDVVLLATRGNASTVEQLSGLLAAQNSRQGYTVRDDGAIAIPEIGTVELAGLSINEAEDVIFQELVEAQLDPSFSLEVVEFNSQRVAVGGAVSEPRPVPISLIPMTLGDALASAGGITGRDEEFLTIRIYRDGSLFQIPVETYLSSDQWRRLPLINGDAIFVDSTYDLDRAFSYFQQEIQIISLRSEARNAALQQLSTEIGLQRAALQERRENFLARTELDAEGRDYVYLAGEVANQSRVALPYGRQASLADVLYGEGGFITTTGDPAEIYVLRAHHDLSSERPIIAYHLNGRNIANMVLATRFEMRPNDIIFIEEQLITKWGRSLQQLFPLVASGAASVAN